MIRCYKGEVTRRGIGFLIVLCFITLGNAANAQSINRNWKTELDQVLTAYKKCNEQSADDAEKCKNSAGEVLKTVYRLNDFYSSKSHRYMVANEVANYLDENSKWELIGHGYEQTALSKAQDLANSNRAVVAVYSKPDGEGHVSIILPGEMVQSGSWGFKVPNSASFFVHDPEKSYVGKGLSYAFKTNMIKNVMLFARSY